LNYSTKQNKSYEQISGKDENTTRDVPLNCKSGRRVTQRFKAKWKEESNVRQNGDEEVLFVIIELYLKQRITETSYMYKAMENVF
jgi:hypothetical protein